MVSSIEFYSIKINVKDNMRFLLILLMLYVIVFVGLMVIKEDLLSFLVYHNNLRNTKLSFKNFY